MVLIMGGLQWGEGDDSAAPWRLVLRQSLQMRYLILLPYQTWEAITACHTWAHREYTSCDYTGRGVCE